MNNKVRKGNRLTPAALIAALLTVLLLCGLPLVSPVSSEKTPEGLSVRVPGFGPGLSAEAEAGLSKGKFLVAGRNMRDVRFVETVILLLDYDKSGAVGLIINRPTKLKLSSVFPEIKGLKQREDTVFIGGPVGQTQAFLLLRSRTKPTDSLEVFEDVYVSSSVSTLRGAVEKPGHGEKFRLYVGYCGWSPGQLEREISRGDWHLIQADPGNVFDRKPSDVWPVLIQRASAQWVKADRPSRQSSP